MDPWIIYGLLAALFAAAVAIFGKLGVSNLDSTLATTVRSTIMALFLLTVSLLLGKFSGLETIDSRAFKYIMLTGIAGACSWLFYFLALKSGPATGVAAMDRLSVVFVLILSSMFLGESLNLKNIFAVALVASGAVLLTLK